MPEWLKVAIGVVALTAMPTISALYIEYLWVIGRELDRSEAAAKNYSTERDKRSSTPLRTPFEPSTAEGNPIRRNDPDQSSSSEMKLTDWLLVAVGVLQFCAIVGQICIYRRQARIMQSQFRVAARAAHAAQRGAKAAQAANRLSVEIFNTGRRPIISVTLRNDKDLVWNDDSVESRIKVTLRNHGNSPAQIIHIDVLPVPASPSLPRNLMGEMNDILGKFKNPSQVFRNLTWATVYLDEPWHIYQDIQINRKDIAQDTFIAVNVLGCIWYASFRGGRVYQAAFSWRLGHVQADNQITPRFQIGENIPGTALRLDRNLSENFDRDVPGDEIHRH
jgi:hypothetical protein